MNRYAIIVAGGSGSRMRNAVLKQFLTLKGKPVLMHSIEKFSRHCSRVVVVLPESGMEEWRSLCEQHNFHIEHTVVRGGIMRADSVKNGLNLIEGDGVVAIHDAARPLITDDLIVKLLSTAEKEGNAIPVLKLSDSLRKITGNESKSVDRSEYRLVQTPQCFDVHMIRNAFLQPGYHNFNDEASLVEEAGYSVFMVDGEGTNIKITLPADLSYAESIVL